VKRNSAVVLALGMASLLAGAAIAQVTPAITAAIADPARSDADKTRDTTSKPAQTIALTGMKAGDKVADLFPGGGYYTRLFSKIVGPAGKVYDVIPDAPPPNAQRAAAFAEGMKAYPNVTIVNGPLTAFKPAEKLDVVWTSENYHDFRIPMFGAQNMASFNKMVFDALKPGGVFYIEDHAAAAGAGDTVTATLHRIDPGTVKKEVEAAGFRLEVQSDILAHPEDTHAAAIFDPSVRGKTDKFVMKFRKPR
jgi:predicted methyltransferase